MLGILIDAGILMILIKTINDDEVDFVTAVIIAIVASVGAAVLAVGLAAAIGVAGIVVAAIIVAAGVGAAVSALLGMEIKRAFLVGGLFMVVHIGVSFGFGLMLST